MTADQAIGSSGEPSEPLPVHPAATPSVNAYGGPSVDAQGGDESAPRLDAQAVEDSLIESARRKMLAGEQPTKEEGNAYFAGGLFNATNRVYFRAGLIACREYMARFVEAQSPEIAASIRANWWPELGPDFGPPRRMAWSELVSSGEEFPVVMREDISPTLEALPIALQFFKPEVQAELEARAAKAGAA